MRRLFIIRKDLHLSAGKLAAMVGHCCEAYWTNLMKAQKANYDIMSFSNSAVPKYVSIQFPLDEDIWNEYVNGIFTKTICEARNLAQLKKVEGYIAEINQEKVEAHLPELTEGVDYGYINDRCLTELDAENADGTTTVGIWFRPLRDTLAHRISKKYKLYRDEKKDHEKDED